MSEFENMRVLPVNFATEHKQFLSHLHLLMKKEMLAVPEKFDKLIISLQMPVANGYSLDKEATVMMAY